MSLTRREFIRLCSITTALRYSSRFQFISADRKRLQRIGSPKKIIVVGAGLAGLSAGYELIQAGHDVILLEARDCPGGRVHTLREPFTDGLYAEAGATRIPDNHELTLSYIKDFDLTLMPFRPSGLSTVYHINGKRLKGKLREDVDWPVDLTEDERKLGLSGMKDRYINSVLKNYADATGTLWPPESLKKYDQMSWTNFYNVKGLHPPPYDC